MLNKEQLQASEIKDDRVLVLAGPGTGKTTTLVSRYKYLINQNVKPEEIICCTFSRRASDEIKSRIQKEVKLNVKLLPIGTFHSLANRAVKKLANTINVTVPNSILSDNERKDIINEIKKENPKTLEGLKFTDQVPSNILKFIDNIREQLIDPEDAYIEASEKGNKIEVAHSEIYKLYEDYLNKKSLVDFARMIQNAFKVFAYDAAHNRSYISQFKHILIDEYQDINFAQKSMVDELLKGGSDLWVVGDDDQAIYGWRGGNVKFILEFENNYINAKKVVLHTNYRSENKIVIAANNLAKRFIERHDKNIISFGNDEGVVSEFKTNDEDAEALKILDLIRQNSKDGSYKDIAILARTNTLPKTVVKTLSAANIPLLLKDNVNLFNDISTKDLLTAVAIAGKIKPQKGWNKTISNKLYAWAKKLSEEDNWLTKVKSLSTSVMKELSSHLKENERKSKEKEIENCQIYLSQFGNAEKAFKVIHALFNEPEDKNGVHIGTIHTAKGLEWDTVILMGCEDDKLPHMMSEELWEIQEERRVTYVAITRPRTNLYLTWAEKRDGHEKLPSPYLNEIFDKKPVVKKLKTKVKESKFVSIMATLNEEVRLYKQNSQKQFEQTIPNITKEEKERRVAFIAENRRAINSSIADGMGYGGGWKIKDTGNGFLLEVGYSAIKDGPAEQVRHDILSNVFNGKIDMPNTLKLEVAKTWGEPNSEDRLRKMRNTINIALGAQKAKTNASKQAIEKWEKDLAYIDNVLKK